MTLPRLILILLLTNPLLSLSATEEISELIAMAGGQAESCALYVRELKSGTEWASCGQRVDQPYTPASTAKIPHTLIAFETGYISSPNALFPWDGRVRGMEMWNQDQTLATAFSRSCVWVYQQIVTDLGYNTMSEWICRIGYGNAQIGSEEELTTYWLDGPLKISARNQVDFLESLVQETLPLSDATFSGVKQVMEEERSGEWILYGKTGWAGGIGWYVGWIELLDGRCYVFAFNMDVTDSAQLPLRRSIVHFVLNTIMEGAD